MAASSRFGYLSLVEHASVALHCPSPTFGHFYVPKPKRSTHALVGAIEWGRRRQWPEYSGWFAPSPSPTRTCDFHHIRLSIRWVRPMWVGNIGFSAIIVGFIHPSSGVVRFVPHPSDCPPSPCGRLSRPRTTTRALPHVRHWLKAGLLRCRRAGRALSGDGAAVGRADPAGLRHPPHRTGRATFTASGSPSGGLDLCGSGT